MVKGIEDSAESIANGVYRNVICDGKVVVYGVSVNARRATDLWAQMVMHDAETWPVDVPYLTMHYFTEGAVEQTPYNRTAATRLAHTIPRELHGRMAVVIQDIPMALMARTFASYMLGILLPRQVKSGVFTEYEAAVPWLEDGIR